MTAHRGLMHVYLCDALKRYVVRSPGEPGGAILSTVVATLKRQNAAPREEFESDLTAFNVGGQGDTYTRRLYT